MTQLKPDVSATPSKDDTITCSASEGFREWLSQTPGSLIVTSRQFGTVLLIGWDGRRITLLARQFDRPKGLAVQGKKLALTTYREVFLFADASLLASDYLPDHPGRYDALYLPRAAYFTNNVDVRDVAFVGDDLWVVSTHFNCLATLDSDYSFTPRWKPFFISDIVRGDRCHLNGLAVVNGRPKYVTARGETDSFLGWQPGQVTGGVVLDVDANEVMLRGLAMPHSPRWHDDKLWLLNAGAGELLAIDPKSGRKDVVCVLPGYARGLCFAGPFALVGLGRIREEHIFDGLPVQKRFDKLICGIAVVDLRNGQMVGRLELVTGCHELFDVRFLPGVRRPMILNLEREERRYAFIAPEFSYWLRPK